MNAATFETAAKANELYYTRCLLVNTHPDLYQMITYVHEEDSHPSQPSKYVR